MNRLYILVCADLSPGLQIAQSCHAMRAFAARYPDKDLAWFQGENNLVVLNVADEAELLAEMDSAHAQGLSLAWFREPDLGGRFTACAIEGAAKKHLRALPLALTVAA